MQSQRSAQIEDQSVLYVGGLAVQDVCVRDVGVFGADAVDLLPRRDEGQNEAPQPAEADQLIVFVGKLPRVREARFEELDLLGCG